MKKLAKKLSALVLSSMFISMQVSAMDTGLGVGNGGATINNTQGGFVNMTTGQGTADLNFNANTHVNWNSLNVNKGETLNFNAVDGAKNLTILNTVNSNMSKIYGNINANEGIGKLIIANPNGVLFDGAKFTASGDVMLTTQPMTAVFDDKTMNIIKTDTTSNLGIITIQNSDFEVAGEFNIMAPSIGVVATTIEATNGLKLITANGQDYLSAGNINVKDAVRLEAVSIDGDVYIIADKGIVKTVGGGKIKGDLNIKSDDSISLNYVANGKALEITGNADVSGNGTFVYARNVKVDGDLNMENGGGFLEVGNVHVGKDMNLTTIAKSENAEGYKHFVHIIGKNKVGGNVKIESKDNIHIGNYKYEDVDLLNGNLNVAGDLTAHAQDGHVMTTIDVQANKISMTSDNLNVLSDGVAKLTANEYEFTANGYIGGITDNESLTKEQRIIAIMENYIPIPETLGTTANINIAGGKVTKISTPTNASAHIASYGDMEVTGANAGNVFLTSYGNDITITGSDVHANTINVGGETDTLKVDFPSRDYTLKYTNIRDAKEVVVNSNDEITYELTNGENGYNINDSRPAKTTYLVGPEKTVEPETPVVPEDNQPQLDDDNENVKVLRGFERPEAVDKVQPYTPVAYAADLEDDQEDSGVRKNVDGSVTVVRLFAMGK